MEDNEKMEAFTRKLDSITEKLTRAHEVCRRWIGPIDPRMQATALIEVAIDEVKALDPRPTKRREHE